MNLCDTIVVYGMAIVKNNIFFLYKKAVVEKNRQNDIIISIFLSGSLEYKTNNHNMHI